MLETIRRLLAGIFGGTRQKQKPKAPVAVPRQPTAPVYPDITFDEDKDQAEDDDIARRAEEIFDRFKDSPIEIPQGTPAEEEPGKDTTGHIEWEALYPEFAVDDGKLLDPEGASEAQREADDDTPWLVAPETSSILEMRVARKDKPGGTQNADQQNRGLLAPYVIMIRFKPSSTGKWAGVVREYEYYFDDPGEGKAIWNAMKSSPHPWGEVGYPKLIGGKVDYQRIR